MTTHTQETIASAMVLACLLIALFAILLAAPLLFLLTHIGAACCAIAGTSTVVRLKSECSLKLVVFTINPIAIFAAAK
jgi:hypothetical protein